MAKLIKNRPALVNDLTLRLLEAMKDSEHDYEAMEVVNAGLRFSQQAIRFVVEHSADHEARILNQSAICSALDVLKLDTVTSADGKMVQ